MNTSESGIAAVGAIFICSVLIGCSSRQQDLELLVSRNAVTDASITGQDCRDHGRIYFKFESEGRTIHGSTTDLSDKRCSEYLPGQKIQVFFDPRNPEVNSVLSPSVAYDHAAEGFGFQILIAVVVIVIAAFRIRRWFLTAKACCIWSG